MGTRIAHAGRMRHAQHGHRQFTLPGSRTALLAICLVWFACTRTNNSQQSAAVDTPATLPGTLPGKLMVGKSGDAAYQVPLDVAPGSGGLKPRLSIDYNSGGGNGILGVGFSLRGLSAVRRGAAVHSIDGFVDPVDFDDNDQFIIDGQRLINVAGAHQQGGAEYRTRQDSFTRVRYYVDDAGRDYFIAESKDGSTMEYGRTPDSRLQRDGKVWSWAVNKISDRNGNYMLFHYAREDADSSHFSQLIERIRYTGNTKTGLEPYNEVRFVYEDRADKSFQFFAGSEIREDKRLAQIVMRYHDGVAAQKYLWDYKLSYESAPASNSSRLVEIRKFGADAEGNAGAASLPGTTFQWQDGEPLSDRTLATVHNSALTLPGNTVVGNGDFDGDGTTDLVVYERTEAPDWKASANYFWILYARDGTFVEERVDLVPCENRPGGSENAHILQVADFDGDGLSDVVDLCPDFVFRQNQQCDCDDQEEGEILRDDLIIRTHFSGRSGHREQRISFTEAVGEFIHMNDVSDFVARPIGVADLNGDGRPEIVFRRGDHIRGILRPTGDDAEFVLDDLTLSNTDLKHVLARGDFNGDGADDLLLRRRRRDYNSDIYFRRPAQFTTQLFSFMNEDRSVDLTGANIGLADIEWATVQTQGDFNGDGLTDLLIAQMNKDTGFPRAGTAWTQLSNGAGSYRLRETPWPQDGPIAFAGDFNRDGLTDFVTSSSDTTKGRFQIDDAFSLQLAVGDGSFRSVPLSLPLASKFSADDKLAIVARTDVDVDGLIEIVVAPRDKYGAHAGERAMSIEIGFDELDLVATITNGVGVRSDIEYALLTDPGVYGKGTSAEYPNIDLLVPMTVVRRTTTTGGSARAADGTTGVGIRERLYSYSHAKQNLTGYGFLGFGSMRVEDVQSKFTILTGFEQDNLDALGMKRGELHLIGTDLVRAFEHDIAVLSLNDGKTTFPYYTRSVERKYNLGNGFGGGEPYFTSVVSNVAPNGAPGFDEYGNIVYTALETTVNGETRTQIISNSVANDTENWILGRGAVSTTEFFVDDQPSITRVVRYTYHPETGQVYRELAHDGQVTEHLYDDYGNEIATGVVNVPSSGDITTTTETVYDDKGRAALITRNALGHETHHTAFHFGFGSPLQTQDPAGQKVTFAHDAFGKLQQTVTKGSDGVDIVSTTDSYTVETVPADVPTAPTNTSLVTVKRATTRPTEVVYQDNLGRELRVAREATDRWVYTDTAYDVFGRTVEKSQPYFAGDAKVVSTSTYDSLGRTDRVVRADDVEFHFAYDGTRTTETRDATGEVPRVQTTVRNSDGDIVEVIDAAGESLFLQRDAVGQLVRTIAGTGASATMLTEITYDSGGRRTRLWDSNAGYKSYRYDKLGRQILTVSWFGNANAVAKPGEATLLEFDLLGRTLSRTSGSGVFDSMLVTTAGADAFDFDDGATHSIFRYDVDRTGTLTYSETNDGTRRSYSYDDDGRRIGERLQLGTADNPPQRDELGTLISGTELRRTTQYDSYGRPSADIYRQELPAAVDLGSLHYGYDAFSRIAKIDGRNAGQQNLTTVADAFEYDANDRLVRYAYGNGIVNNMAFDPHTGRLIASRAGTATAPASVEDMSFVYDAQGNLVQRTRMIPNTPSTLTGYQEEFGYDVLDRLATTKSSALHAGGLLSFDNETVTYDRLGNIKQRTAGRGTRTIRTYDYDSARLHAVTRITTDKANSAGAILETSDTEYAYDFRGQITQRGDKEVTWTAFGKPETIDTAHTLMAFAYDSNGNRVRQTTHRAGVLDPERVKLYFDPTLEIEQTVAGDLTSSTVFAVGPQGPIALLQYSANDGASRKYLHKDHLGSIVSVTDESGETVQRLHFDAWGRARTKTADPDWSLILLHAEGDHLADRGYTGHETLGDGSLVHMNARIYDPEIGRFLSPDGLVQAPANLQNYNRYSYVLNQPLSLTDPSGNGWFAAVVAIIVEIAIVAATVAIDLAIYLATNPGVWGKIWSAYTYGKQALQGDWQGALRGLTISLVTWGLTSGIGSAFDGLAAEATSVGGQVAVEVARAATHGAVRGGLAEAQGGEFSDGFIAGATASALDSTIGAAQVSAGQNPTEFSFKENIAVGLATGTVSQLTGGKFMNGFATGTSINRYNKTGNTSTEKSETALKTGKKFDVGGKIATAINDPTHENILTAGSSVLVIIDDHAPNSVQLVTAPIAMATGVAADSSTPNVVSQVMIMAGSQVVTAAKIFGAAAKVTRFASPLGIIVQGGLAAPDAYRAFRAFAGLVIDSAKAQSVRADAPISEYDIQQALSARAARQ